MLAGPRPGSSSLFLLRSTHTMPLDMLRRAVSRSPSRDRSPRDRSKSRDRDSSPDSRRNSLSSLLIPGRRSSSPFPGALRNDYEDIPIKMGPQGLSVGAESSEDSSDDDGLSFSSLEFSDETNENTERNALSPMLPTDDEEHHTDRDPLGEGINVVFDAPEPHFSTPSHARGKAKETHPGRPTLTTAPAKFTRDCCTVTVTQGDPAKALSESGRKPKTYLVCSDMSAESKFALDWAIGMVLRDGDVL